MIKNVALASLVAASAVMAQQQADSSQLRIDTPNGPVACQPSRITWGGGQPPYYVTILKGGESSGQPLADLTGGSPTDETSLTWWVNLEPGTSITATIKDSTGAQNSAAKVDVAAGGNTDCIQKPLSVSIAGAMATPSGSSNGETPQPTNSEGGGEQGGGDQGGNTVVGGAGGNGGGDQQQTQGGDQQASATPSAGGDQSAAPSGEQSGSAAAPSGEQSGSAAPTSSAGGADASSSAAQSGASQSGGNAASSGSSAASNAASKASSATSGAGGAATSAAAGGDSSAAALVPGFVAPALAALVAAFAL